MKKLFVIFLLIVVLMYSLQAIVNQATRYNVLLAIVFIYGVACGRYLYKNAYSNKELWSIIGFFGNVGALIIFWYFNYTNKRWSQGKSFFHRELPK